MNKRGFINGTLAVATIAASVLLYATMSLMSSGIRGTASFTQNGEFEAIRKTVIESLSCENTMSAIQALGMSAQACAKAGVPIPLMSKHNQELVSYLSSDPTRIGSWTLRARCTDDGISIEAARPVAGSAGTVPVLQLTNPNQFARDPLTKRVYTWSHPKMIFPVGALPCAERFLAAATTPAPLPTTTPVATPTPSPTKTPYVNPVCVTPPCEYTSEKVAVRKGDLIEAPTDRYCNNSLMWHMPVHSVTSFPPGVAPQTPPYPAPSYYVNAWEVTHKLVHWRGLAVCPDGYHAVGGGANCQVPATITGNSYGGVMLESHVSSGSDGRPNAWFADCCANRSAFARATFPRAVYVVCQPD